jgi:hypothetical protein
MSILCLVRGRCGFAWGLRECRVAATFLPWLSDSELRLGKVYRVICGFGLGATLGLELWSSVQNLNVNPDEALPV